jgi:4,5-dihydroxyphthalate decarboxylase
VWEEQQAVLGHDPWKFGIQGNEKALNALIRYADEQGLLAKKMTIGDLLIQIDEPRL